MSDSAVRAAAWRLDLPTLARSPRDRRFDRVRWLLIVVWIPVIACLPFAAQRTSSWGHLEHAVSSGAVTRVEVNGELPSGADGFSTVDLHWREHGLNYEARVVQAHGRLDEDACLNDDACMESSDTTLHSAPGARLQELQPGLTVTRHPRGAYDDDRLLGFAVPMPLAIVEAALGLAALVVLVAGPQPWRATRWAWLWWFTNPIGMAGLLLLSGPVPGLPKPSNVGRRITGGWSLIGALVLSGVTFSIWRIHLT